MDLLELYHSLPEEATASVEADLHTQWSHLSEEDILRSFRGLRGMPSTVPRLPLSYESVSSRRRVCFGPGVMKWLSP